MLQALVETFTSDSARISELTIAILKPWYVQFSVVAILVWLTLKVISRVYSGDIQNTPIGPLALKTHVGEPAEKTQKFIGPSAVFKNMGGLHARCQFMYVYEDEQGERHYIKLKMKKQASSKRSRRPNEKMVRTRQFHFNTRDRRFKSDGDFLLGREVPDAIRSENIYLHNPDGDAASIDIVSATPELAADWAKLQKERDLTLSGTEIVSIPEGVCASLAQSRDEFLVELSSKIEKRRSKPKLLRIFDPNTPDKRPAVIGYYYVRLSFDTGTWFVLFNHPDRELKMTAWLTVLTSFFGFIMGKMP